MHRSYANNLVQSRTSSKDRLGFPEHLDQPSSTKPIYSNFMKKRKISIKPQQEPLLSRLSLLITEEFVLAPVKLTPLAI